MIKVIKTVKTMKKGIRIIGIDDSPFEKFGRRKKVLVVGVVQRDMIVEGILSTYITKDGNDATNNIIKMLKRSRFLPQIRIILLNGTMFGGFNVVDINAIYKALNIPVIAITRKKPKMKEVFTALRKASKSDEEYERKVAIIKECSFPKEIKIEFRGCMKGIAIQTAGIGFDQAEGILKKFGVDSLRLAHIIGSGIITGESSGKF
jgi:hypothetical protein